MFIVHWYVTNKALVMIASGIPCSDHRVESEFCSGIASLAVPNLERKVIGDKPLGHPNKDIIIPVAMQKTLLQ